VEDGLRFCFENRALTNEAKSLRHHLSEIFMKNFHSVTVKKYRESETDIGKKNDIFQKSNVTQLIERNLLRISESLRSMEEFSKVINPEISRRFHTLRFNFYQMEKKIITEIYRKKIPVPSLYIILNIEDNSEIFGFAEKVISGKPDVIQLRYKGENSSYFMKTAKELRRMVPEDIIFLINDRVDICLICEADGVHLGKKDIPVEAARKLLPEKIIGVSCGNLQDIRRFTKKAVDYIAIGALFQSPTKPEKKATGTNLLTLAEKEITIPLIGIGGINLKNVNEVLKKGATGIAVISVIQNSPDPEKTILQLKKALSNKKSSW